VTILVSDDRFVSFSEVDARIGEVCFGPTSGLRQPACQVRKVPTTIIRNRLNSASEVNVDAHCARLSNWGFPKAYLKSLVMAKKVKSLAYSHKN
jgi:hypothetical protein